MDEGSMPTRPPQPDVDDETFWKTRIRDKLIASHENHTIHGRLDPHQILKSLTEIKIFYSGHDVHPSRIIDNENFARWAIEEALEEYQPGSNFKTAGNIMEGRSVNISKQLLLDKITEAIQVEGQQDIDAEDPNGSKGSESEIVQDVSAVAETIISASPNSLGPPIEACVSYLRMEKCGTFGRNNLTVWKSPFFPKLDGQEGRKGFLDNQVTAIVWIMANMLGSLPQLKIKLPEYWNPTTDTYNFPRETEIERKHRKRLRRPRYFGGILADSMGLGKTLTTITCLDLMMAQRLHVVKKQGGGFKHCPVLILTPNLIVASQWVDEIEQIGNTASIKKIIMSGEGARKKAGQLRTRVLKASEFREWPDDLSYVWDEDDPRASKVIIVMSIDTWSSRTCTTKVIDKNGKVVEGDWHSTFTDLERQFSIVVVDEAYKVRHTTTRYWKSVALLDRQFTLLITATPCMNLLVDLMGPVRLLWDRPERYLQENMKKWLNISKKFEVPSHLDKLDKMDSFDDHQLIAGRDAIVSQLIKKFRGDADIQETRKYLKYFEKLAILRRAPGSNLHWDWKGSKLVSLDGLLPKVSNFTVNIQLDCPLEAAYQNAHFKLLIKYMGMLKKLQIRRGEKKSEKKKKIQGRRHDETSKKQSEEEKEKFESVLAMYLQFELAAASVDIFRLEKLFSENGFGIKAEHVKLMRHNNVNFLHFAAFLLRPGDKKPRTALDYVKLAVRKSPILRYILHHVKEKVLDRKPGEKIKKLLIIEARPILAYYYEIVLQFLLINCRTLHAGLSGEQRRELIDSFNDDGDHSCQILIQMYSVGFAGSNLHKSCSQVLVASQAHSFPIQMQAVHRVIRVGQKKNVEVYRLKVNNSFHQFRESRQVEKILPELGTRAQGSMVNILVQLLNLFQFEIDDAVNSPEGQELLQSMNLLIDKDTVVEGDDQPYEDDDSWEEYDSNSEEEDNQSEDGSQQDDTSEEDDDKSEDDSDDEASATKRARLEDETDSNSGDSEKDSSESKADSQDKNPIRPKNEGTKNLFKNDLNQFLRLQSRAAYYNEFKNFPKEVKSRFSHDKNNLRRLLSYSIRHGKNGPFVWTAEDLNDSAVLERAMELALRTRLGAKNIEMLPLPHISFTRVREEKLQRLTQLLGESNLTAQDIDDLIEERKETRRSRDTSGELRLVQDGMTLDEIDAAFKLDITKGDNAQSRKRKRDEAAMAADATVGKASESTLAYGEGWNEFDSDCDDWDKSSIEDEEEYEEEEEAEEDEEAEEEAEEKDDEEDEEDRGAVGEIDEPKGENDVLDE
ncbi:SNF2 family N-terminal domain-containing protein [Annulohypoxylon maeteangense]|uniref:SNF2 family N-terminal domain-containing protein n=1 Tax=Annulohypoxylon maeteangense TaxID=1927788 RepID=UPI002007BDCF|nr:SNF2 family N-terminal domain-containing protein [Annulohypoxylon maeteangense]KAI0885784.1 SNF2 family N-terminal domain-containing protein [Annulohypoxylon maeteangense]